jgi:hypothetical protein
LPGSLRLEVIQTTNDHYVTASQSRQLLGPDTDTLRLYAIEARNHRFSNARDKLMKDLDDALRWIGKAPPRSADGASAAEGCHMR